MESYEDLDEGLKKSLVRALKDAKLQPVAHTSAELEFVLGIIAETLAPVVVDYLLCHPELVESGTHLSTIRASVLEVLKNTFTTAMCLEPRVNLDPLFHHLNAHLIRIFVERHVALRSDGLSSTSDRED